MGTSRNTALKPLSPRRGDGDAIDQYSAIVWRGTDVKTMQKLWFDNPVDALSCAVEYLKRGYQTRISDGAVAHFESLPTEAKALTKGRGVPVPRFVAVDL